MKLGMHKSRGFSLIEIIITIVLVGVMMAGITVMFAKNVNESHRPYLRQRTLAVANAFMEEISKKRWDENTPIGGGCVVPVGPTNCTSAIAWSGFVTEEGAARATYDDVDDYIAIVGQSPPRDSVDIAMPGYPGFSVTVTIIQPAANWNGIPRGDVKLITVNVTSPTNETITLQNYRLNI